MTLVNDAFSPPVLTIQAGQTVTFHEPRRRCAHGYRGGVWSYRFDKPGTYAYFCDLHPFATLGAGGLPTGRAVSATATEPLEFVQTSDSHIGFHQPANPDVTGTLQLAVDAINALPKQPRFVG
ncbi:MAG TPA: hypothetical protein VKR56_16580 [Candidatus Cybelea sp.]|nr:hypothetical protein [Candidatus Cybelea sp.]